MATAPTPGGDKVAPHYRIRVKDRTLEVPTDIRISEKLVVRASTGLPVESFFPVGEDSLAVIWWLARRHNGEPTLAFAQAMADWDAMTIEEGDLDIEEVEVGKDDPEGQGPAS